MLASKLHWRALIATVLLLMAAAFVAPRFVPAPLMQENRELAPRPERPESLTDLDRLRTQTDAYIADHFPLRTHAIALLNRARMQFGVTGSNRVLVGRDGWLFFDNGSHLGAARNAPPMTPEEVRAWLAGLAGRSEALKARGIPYLVVVAPLKEVIYPEKAPAWFGQAAPDRPARVLPRLAEAAGAGDVLYLGDAVAAAKSAGRVVYSRHDTHWNGYGAHAGYSAMMSWLQARGLTEGPVPAAGMTIYTQHGGVMPRDLAVMLGVASFVAPEFTHLVDETAQRGVVMTYIGARQDWTSPYVVDTVHKDKPVLLILRDSFSVELEPWLYNHFSRIVIAHKQDGAFREDLIDRYKPDLAILEVLEASLGPAMDPAPAASRAAMARIDRAMVAAGYPVPAPPPALSPTTPGEAAAMNAAAPRGCNFEIARLNVVMGSSELTVGGWISEVAPVNTAPWGLIRLTGPGVDLSSPIRVDGERADVAAYFKQPAAAKSGFSGVFQLPVLPPGTYQTTAYRRTPGGWMACRGLASIVVAP